jgi:hypothetical protein
MAAMLTDATALVIPGDVASALDIPSRLDDIGGVLRDGLAVGEQLGVPVDDAERALDAVTARAEPVLTAAEVQMLFVVYAFVHATLDEGIDADGLPADNSFGAGLIEVGLMNARGAVPGPSSLPLAELSGHLEQICLVLSDAMQRDYGVRLERG